MDIKKGKILNNKKIIIANLEQLGMSAKEGEIYYELVKQPLSNGSQIAKKLGYPRASVYGVLSKLQEKGHIMALQEGEITSYSPVSPQLLLTNLKKKMESAIEILDKEFKEIETEILENQFYNLNSQAGVEERILQILENSEKEIYINTNWDLSRFKDTFKKLADRGVRIILFTFSKINYEEFGIEVYRSSTMVEDETSKHRRILIVADMEKAIIASNYGGNFSGTYSENNLLIFIVVEHIHNDIYIKKLSENIKTDFWENIALHSMQELLNKKARENDNEFK